MDPKSFQTVEAIAIDREEWQRKYFALLNQTVELQAQRDALLAALQFYMSICGNTAYSVTRESALEAYEMAQTAIALTQKEEV